MITDLQQPTWLVSTIPTPVLLNVNHIVAQVQEVGHSTLIYLEQVFVCHPRYPTIFTPGPPVQKSFLVPPWTQHVCAGQPNVVDVVPRVHQNI